MSLGGCVEVLEKAYRWSEVGTEAVCGSPAAARSQRPKEPAPRPYIWRNSRSVAWGRASAGRWEREGFSGGIGSRLVSHPLLILRKKPQASPSSFLLPPPSPPPPTTKHERAWIWVCERKLFTNGFARATEWQVMVLTNQIRHLTLLRRFRLLWGQPGRRSGLKSFFFFFFFLIEMLSCPDSVCVWIFIIFMSKQISSASIFYTVSHHQEFEPT